MYANVLKASMIRSLFLFSLLVPNFVQAQPTEVLKLKGQFMMPFSGGPRDDGSAAVLNDIGYYGLGNNQYFEVQKDWWAYYPLDDRWERRSDIPGAPRQYCTSFSSDQSVFVFGGILDDGTIVSELLEYNAVNDSWKQINTSVPTRAKAFGFRIGPDYYLGGGQNDTMALGDFWQLNIASGLWTKLDSLPFSPRYPMVSFVSEGIGYACLGQDSINTYNSCWEFQVATNAWREVAAFPGRARTFATSIGSNSGGIVFGGQNDKAELNSEVYSFDKESNAWNREIDLIYPEVRGMEGFSILDGYYLIGGLTQNFTRISAVQRYGEEEKSELVDVKVWPNPTRSGISIFIIDHVGKNSEELQVHLFDTHGIVVGEAKISGQNDFRTLDTESLGNGIYFLRVASEAYSVVQKISVMK
ncbi:MAG TPA: hypothetical protein DCX14_00985 [Flavobacteriales bacterium]|nr:hypothetical protein [Flavobacteriales bacterium]